VQSIPTKGGGIVSRNCPRCCSGPPPNESLGKKEFAHCDSNELLDGGSPGKPIDLEHALRQQKARLPSWGRLKGTEGGRSLCRKAPSNVEKQERQTASVLEIKKGKYMHRGKLVQEARCWGSVTHAQLYYDERGTLSLIASAGGAVSQEHWWGPYLEPARRERDPHGKRFGTDWGKKRIYVRD